MRFLPFSPGPGTERASHAERDIRAGLSIPVPHGSPEMQGLRPFESGMPQSADVRIAGNRRSL